MRYFRTTPEAYRSACDAINTAFGYPSTAGGVPTETFLTPEESAPHDSDGNVLLGLRNMEAEQAEVAPSLAAFAEITAVEYEQSIVSP